MTGFGIEAAISPASAKAALRAVLGRQQYAVSWTDEWTAVANKGSVIRFAMLDWLSPRMRLRLTIIDAGPGRSIVRCDRLSSGLWIAGLTGLLAVRRKVRALAEAIAREIGSLTADLSLRRW